MFDYIRFLSKTAYTLIFLVVFVAFFHFFGQKSFTTKAGPVYYPLYAYESHPNFWELERKANLFWVGKKYTLVPGSANPNPYHDKYYVYSGPWHNTNYDYRSIFYQAYNGSTPAAIKEYEEWTGDQAAHYARVYKFGGSGEYTAKRLYPTKSNCQYLTNPGVTWPTVQLGSTFAYSPMSVRYPDTNHCTDPYPTGDYLAIKMIEDWGSPGSFLRNTRCDQWIPDSHNHITNLICKASYNVSIFQQRYVISKNLNDPGPKFDHGCEMTIYAYGYPKVEGGNSYRYWFRNGELRFTDYLSVAKLDSRKSPLDDTWWINACTGNSSRTAWDFVPNWYYTGTYKITLTEYHDPGY